jgi:hypothetical protein
VLWVTRHNPHVDRCASAWLIKRFIDKKAIFLFISKDDTIPEGAVAFTLPKADIKPVEKEKTTYDVLMAKNNVQDTVALKIGKFIHDFEIDADENPEKVKYKETLGLCYVLKSLEKTSKTDSDIIDKALTVLDAFCTSLTDQ